MAMIIFRTSIQNFNTHTFQNRDKNLSYHFIAENIQKVLTGNGSKNLKTPNFLI